jgi:proteasome lid subunit RPN8/RPN11
MSSVNLAKLEEKGISLNQSEQSALEKHLASREADQLMAARTSAEFLGLYLQGYSTVDIQKMNPGFSLGFIVKARLDYEWDKYKKEYIQALMTSTRDAVLKVQLEALRFAADGMAVHQRVIGDAFRKFLQTGRKEDLGEYKDTITVKNYKEYIALMMQLTGQDKEKKVVGDIHHTHTTAPDMKTIDISAEGADILKLLDKK